MGNKTQPSQPNAKLQKRCQDLKNQMQWQSASDALLQRKLKIFWWSSAALWWYSEVYRLSFPKLHILSSSPQMQKQVFIQLTSGSALGFCKLPGFTGCMYQYITMLCYKNRAEQPLIFIAHIQRNCGCSSPTVHEIKI